ncbi:MAG: hypothetical protein KBD76_06420 [Bacteriovorax sp.]|jgi:hypothetical protein|nr:hypothetical protein [Bacteriovorax sp.]
MNSDGITRISLLRNLYKSQGTSSSSEMVRELQEIKNELKISNDEKVREEEPLSNVYKSPYLPDQIFFRKDAVYNSSEETKWKEVKSSEQVQKEVQENLTEANRRKLNIL